MCSLIDKEEHRFRERAVAQLRVLWERRRYIAAGTCAGVVLGLLIGLLIPPQFRSNARLMPPQLQQEGATAMLAATLGKAAGNLGTYAASQLAQQDDGAVVVGILESRTVLDRLITRFDLRKHYGVSEWSRARKKLAARTSIITERKSGIVNIEVRDRSPQLAASLARAYTEELNLLLSELSNSAAGRERLFLEQRLKVVKAELENSEKELSQFSSKSATYDLKDQSRSVMDAAAMLQGQLIAAEAELQSLKPLYGDDNVRMRSVRARIAELRANLEKIGGKGGVVPADSTSTFSPPLRSLPLLGATYADLYRQARVQEAVYEALTRQYELARVEEAKQVPSVKVLEVPDVPARKVYPPRMLLALLAGLTAFTLSLAYVLGAAAWQQLDAHDPAKLFALDILRSLPGVDAGLHLQRDSGVGKLWMRLRHHSREHDQTPAP